MLSSCLYFADDLVSLIVQNEFSTANKSNVLGKPAKKSVVRIIVVSFLHSLLTHLVEMPLSRRSRIKVFIHQFSVLALTVVLFCNPSYSITIGPSDNSKSIGEGISRSPGIQL